MQEYSQGMSVCLFWKKKNRRRRKKQRRRRNVNWNERFKRERKRQREQEKKQKADERAQKLQEREYNKLKATNAAKMAEKRKTTHLSSLSCDRQRRKRQRPSDLEEDIDSNRCCACFGFFEDDDGTGQDWLQCSCGRWIHEDCVDLDTSSSNGLSTKLCPLCYLVHTSVDSCFFHCLTEQWHNCTLHPNHSYLFVKSSPSSKLCGEKFILLDDVILRLLKNLHLRKNHF